jgi:hypothetical protein
LLHGCVYNDPSREDLKKHVKLTKDDDATIDMNQVTAIRIPDDPGWNQSLKEAVRYLPRIQRIQIPRIDHKVLHICSQWNELTELSVDKNSYQWFNTPTTIYFQSPWHREMFRVVDSVIGLAPHLSEIVGSYVPYLQTDASQLKNRVSPCGPQELGLVTTQKSPEMVFHNLQHLVVRSMTSPILENLWRERFPALTSLHIEPDRTYDSPFTKEQNRCLLASVNYLRQLNRLTLIGTNIDLCFLQSLFLSSDADDQQLKWLCISGQNATQPFYDVLAKTSVVCCHLFFLPFTLFTVFYYCTHSGVFGIVARFAFWLLRCWGNSENVAVKFANDQIKFFRSYPLGSFGTKLAHDLPARDAS